jgi:WhiB family redox-sensing transcriptional regulator
MSWQRSGACRPADRDVFFGADLEHPADKAARERKAIAICRRCPAEAACLDWHLSFRAQHGVAGGTGEDERRALRNAALKREKRAAV